MSVLRVNGLQVCFTTRKGEVYAVHDLSFSLEAGKTLAIVGESGSGKSVTAMSVLRLLDENGRIEKGEILFDDGQTTCDLTRLSPTQMRGIRGNKISMIFQEPMTALNPVFSIGKQLAEPFQIHRGMKRKEAFASGVEMLEKAFHWQHR